MLQLSRWELVSLLRLFLQRRELLQSQAELADDARAKDEEAETRANQAALQQARALATTRTAASAAQATRATAEDQDASDTRDLMEQHRLPILLEVVRKMMDPPAPLQPVLAPTAARRLVDRIERQGNARVEMLNVAPSGRKKRSAHMILVAFCVVCCVLVCVCVCVCVCLCV